MANWAWVMPALITAKMVSPERKRNVPRMGRSYQLYSVRDDVTETWRRLEDAFLELAEGERSRRATANSLEVIGSGRLCEKMTLSAMVSDV